MKRQGPNSDIDDIMDDLQKDLISNKIMFVGVLRNVNEDCGQLKKLDSPALGQPVIPTYPAPVVNVTVNPIINVTSTSTESTKNSPLRDLGSFLAPLFKIKK